MASQKPIKRMDDATLRSMVDRHVASSISMVTTELSKSIRQATKYYYGEALGNEVKGKSQVVSRDVGDAVDWIMPSLMRIFGGDSPVCEFESTNGDDIAEAEQATDYINYIYNKRNEGFKITYQFIKDILLNKNGHLQVYVKDTDVPQSDFFTRIDKDTLTALLSEPNVEAVELTDHNDGYFDVRLVTTTTEREYVVEVIPPEEFLIIPNAIDVDSSEFKARRRKVSYSDLRLLGYSDQALQGVSWDSGSSVVDTQGVYDARHAPEGTTSFSAIAATSSDPSQRTAWYVESFINVDYDGDGIAELRRVCTVGSTVLANEEVDDHPFISATATMISHKFYGLSMYDRLKDIQQIKTSLLRNQLDNMYNINAGRWEVLEGQVNMDDLLKNASKGVVRVKMAGALKQLDTPQLPTENFQMLSYLDSIREDRSGISKTSQGLNADILHSNQSSNAVNQVMTAAQQQIELFARVIAETGFKPLFKKLYGIVIKHQDQDDIFRLRGKFVPVSPAEWKKQRNVTVVAGLGNHNKDQQLMHLQNMWQITQGLLSSGGMNIVTDYDKIYNLLAKISENSGYPDFQKYWRDPSSPEGQAGIQALQQAQSKPSPDDIKAQAQAQKVQGDLQIDGQKAQAEMQLRSRELDIREREVAIKEKEVLLDQDRISLERERLALDKYSAISDAQITLATGRNVGIGDGQVARG